jgi:hypothetical protein
MKYTILFVFVVISIIDSTFGSLFNTCLKFKGQDNFDSEKYSGNWYIHFADVDATCFSSLYYESEPQSKHGEQKLFSYTSNLLL